MAHCLLLSRLDQLAIFGPFDDLAAAEAYGKILAGVMKQDPLAENDKIAYVKMVNVGPPPDKPRIIVVNP